MAGSYAESQALLQDFGEDADSLHSSNNGYHETMLKKGCDNGRNIMRAPCRLDIMEPEASRDMTGEMEAYMVAVLAKYKYIWLERTEHQLGYPGNLDFNYDAFGPLHQFLLNNCGDPFIEGNYGVHSRDFEVRVLDWFASLWEIEKSEYWGYITSGGTEGNLHGILVGRELHPDGILYASKEAHYSVFKVARMYRMDYVKTETLVSGEIDCGSLKASLFQNKDKPAIIVITIGTTMKGGVDDLDLVIQTLKECGFPRNRFYIHCDAALLGLMLPFLDLAPQISFKKQIDSISISGHKFVGCPMPCGVQIVRKEHINILSSKNVEYINTRDATILGSRNGQAPVFLWYALSRKGYHGLREEVQQCMHNARHLKCRLRKAGVSAMLNELSNTVVFARPQDEEFIQHWQLSCQGNIAHVVVMPHVTIEKLNTFLDELVEKRLIWFKDEGNQPICVASDIGIENCICPLHK